MLPPTVLDPFEAKSTGQVSPSGAACWCTASVIAPAWTRSVLPRVSIRSTRRMRDKESTTSPFAATAPPASPVRPPDGTDTSFLRRVANREEPRYLGRGARERDGARGRAPHLRPVLAVLGEVGGLEREGVRRELAPEAGEDLVGERHGRRIARGRRGRNASGRFGCRTCNGVRPAVVRAALRAGRSRARTGPRTFPILAGAPLRSTTPGTARPLQRHVRRMTMTQERDWNALASAVLAGANHPGPALEDAGVPDRRAGERLRRARGPRYLNSIANRSRPSCSCSPTSRRSSSRAR